MSEVQPDIVRCMNCLRLSYVSQEYRGKRLRCGRCGGIGLNLMTIRPDAGSTMRNRKDERRRRRQNAETW